MMYAFTFFTFSAMCVQDVPRKD